MGPSVPLTGGIRSLDGPLFIVESSVEGPWPFIVIFTGGCWGGVEGGKQNYVCLG